MPADLVLAATWLSLCGLRGIRLSLWLLSNSVRLDWPNYIRAKCKRKLWINSKLCAHRSSFQGCTPRLFASRPRDGAAHSIRSLHSERLARVTQSRDMEPDEIRWIRCMPAHETLTAESHAVAERWGCCAAENLVRGLQTIDCHLAWQV